jgi:ADP-heptose:LPS heptosyltransferase
VPKTRFFSLQVGDRAADPSDLGLDRQIEDLSADLTDFAETAAALSVLDLLITVDTAPAHLAGALGRPVWILVPFRPDWRWLLERGDSPWYPSMQLFRQPEQADWDRVVMTLRDKLTALAAGDG